MKEDGGLEKTTSWDSCKPTNTLLTAEAEHGAEVERLLGQRNEEVRSRANRDAHNPCPACAAAVTQHLLASRPLAVAP